MSIFFGWFYSNKAVDENEQKKALDLHNSLFKEMKQLFYDCDITKKAELYYDYDDIIETLNSDVDRITGLTSKCQMSTYKKTIYPSEKIKQELRDACVKYFDHVVEYKRFIEDNPLLQLAIAKKLLEHALLDDLMFDWHYWQLFRRDLKKDILDTDTAIEIIENGPPDSDEELDDSFDSQSVD